MKHLLIVAHGSRRQASNGEVEQLAAQLHASPYHDFTQISCAFLELASPSSPQGIQQAIDAGATEVVVMPYFLSAGRHVSEDIPAAIAEVQPANPAISIRLIPYLGSLAGIADLMLNHAQASS